MSIFKIANRRFGFCKQPKTKVSFGILDQSHETTEREASMRMRNYFWRLNLSAWNARFPSQ